MNRTFFYTTIISASALALAACGGENESGQSAEIAELSNELRETEREAEDLGGQVSDLQLENEDLRNELTRVTTSMSATFQEFTIGMTNIIVAPCEFAGNFAWRFESQSEPTAGWIVDNIAGEITGNLAPEETSHGVTFRLKTLLFEAGREVLANPATVHCVGAAARTRAEASDIDTASAEVLLRGRTAIETNFQVMPGNPNQWFTDYRRNRYTQEQVETRFLHNLLGDEIENRHAVDLYMFLLRRHQEGGMPLVEAYQEEGRAMLAVLDERPELATLAEM